MASLFMLINVIVTPMNNLF